MTGSWSERTVSHIGTETRPRLLREAAVGNIRPMRESVTERHRVGDEDLWIVKPFYRGRKPGKTGVTVP